jgi:hypothetical protein
LHNCSLGTVEDDAWGYCGPNCTAVHNCSIPDWPWRSKTSIIIEFILVAHAQTNESLLLDEFAIFGQIGGNAGNDRFCFLAKYFKTIKKAKFIQRLI